MKNLVILIALSFVAFSSFAKVSKGNSNDPVKANKVAVMNGESTAKIVYIDENKQKVTITIMNEKGEEIATTYVKNKSGFIQPLNFKGLPYGEYSLKIEDDNGAVYEKYNYTKKESTIQSSVYDINNSKKFKLFVVSNEESPVNVKVMNNNKEVVYESEVENSKSFSQIIDLSKIQDKNFTFYVSNGKDSAYINAE